MAWRNWVGACRSRVLLGGAHAGARSNVSCLARGKRLELGGECTRCGVGKSILAREHRLDCVHNVENNFFFGYVILFVDSKDVCKVSGRITQNMLAQFKCVDSDSVKVAKRLDALSVGVRDLYRIGHVSIIVVHCGRRCEWDGEETTVGSRNVTLSIYASFYGLAVNRGKNAGFDMIGYDHAKWNSLRLVSGAVFGLVVNNVFTTLRVRPVTGHGQLRERFEYFHRLLAGHGCNVQHDFGFHIDMSIVVIICFGIRERTVSRIGFQYFALPSLPVRNRRVSQPLNWFG